MSKGTGVPFKVASKYVVTKICTLVSKDGDSVHI